MHPFARLREEARSMTLREAVREVRDAFHDNELLTYASAIAFCILLALIPFALFALGLLGGFGLDGVWTEEVAPELRNDMSPAAFNVVDDTVRKVLGERQLFWMTIGAAIAVWEMSAGVRATMDAFDRIYDSDRDRPIRERYLVSFALAIGCGLLVLTATAVLVGGGLALDGPLELLRWPIGVALLLATVAALIHYAPTAHQPVAWVGFGAAVIVAVWIGASAAFAAYLIHLGQYGSIFGALATFFVLFQYLLVASIAFLAGAQLDALVRERAADQASEDGAARRTVAAAAAA